MYILLNRKLSVSHSPPRGKKEDEGGVRGVLSEFQTGVGFGRALRLSRNDAEEPLERRGRFRLTPEDERPKDVTGRRPGKTVPVPG